MGPSQPGSKVCVLLPRSRAVGGLEEPTSYLSFLFPPSSPNQTKVRGRKEPQSSLEVGLVLSSQLGS